jgi:XTP/dITP diphosphohydrolase
MSARGEPALAPHVLKLLLASSNSGKLREFRAMAALDLSAAGIALELLPRFSELPRFDETAPTFAENAAGKALHYSRFVSEAVLADDSGLVVDALDGAPGVRSARYAGPDATDGQRVLKLLAELDASGAANRSARFVCVIALARAGRILGVFSAAVQGEIAASPRGADGFGYDPVFLVPELGKTFAEISSELKNIHSHRGKAFRKLLVFLGSAPALT